MQVISISLIMKIFTISLRITEMSTLVKCNYISDCFCRRKLKNMYIRYIYLIHHFLLFAIIVIGLFSNKLIIIDKVCSSEKLYLDRLVKTQL